MRILIVKQKSDGAIVAAVEVGTDELDTWKRLRRVCPETFAIVAIPTEGIETVEKFLSAAKGGV